jgi:hypothetical protein
VVGAVDVDAGLSRPLEGSQPLHWLPIRKADDLIISFEDEPFVGGAEPVDARRHFSATVWTSIFQLIAVFRTYGR